MPNPTGACQKKVVCEYDNHSNDCFNSVTQFICETSYGTDYSWQGRGTDCADLLGACGQQLERACFCVGNLALSECINIEDPQNLFWIPGNFSLPFPCTVPGSTSCSLLACPPVPTTVAPPPPANSGRKHK